MCMQVDCTPPGNLVVDVRQARASLGGFIQLALEQVRTLTLCRHFKVCMQLQLLMLSENTIKGALCLKQVAGIGSLDGVSLRHSQVPATCLWHRRALLTPNIPHDLGEYPCISAVHHSIHNSTLALPSVQGSNAPWVPLKNSFGAVWQSTGQLPVPPFDVQIINAATPSQTLVAQ